MNGVGLSASRYTCALAIYACITFYALSKVSPTQLGIVITLRRTLLNLGSHLRVSGGEGTLHINFRSRLLSLCK